MQITIDTDNIFSAGALTRDDTGKKFTIVAHPPEGLSICDEVTFRYSSSGPDKFVHKGVEYGIRSSRHQDCTLLAAVKPVLIDAKKILAGSDAPDGEYVALTGKTIPPGEKVTVRGKSVTWNGEVYTKDVPYFFLAPEEK
jgi:hypothetical protein